MSTVYLIVALVFVLLVLGAAAFALFELSPFARHEDVYHLPGVRQDSPRLD
jgi:hypothetical protein